MVKRCEAINCSKTYQDGVSLHSFLPDLRLEWTRQVQRTHANWPGSTKNSFLCCDQFTGDCYEEDTAIAEGFGIVHRKKSTPKERCCANSVSSP